MSAGPVLDASVLAGMLIDDATSDTFDDVMRRLSRAQSPDYAITECANAVWKRFMRDEFSAKDAAERLADLERYPVEYLKTPPLLPRALLTSIRTRHPLYDCIYIALAEQEGAELITADARQAEAARTAGVRVRLLREE